MRNTARRRQVSVGCAATLLVVAMGFSGAFPGAFPGAVAVAEPVTPPSDPFQVPVPGPAAATPTPGAPATATPARSGTLRDYFNDHGVQLEAQQPDDLTALDITLPVPSGWTRVPDPNVPDAFAVIANRHSGALYTPNAQVVVYRLVGEFDPKEAISHGYVNSQQLSAWRTAKASMADFGDFPSSMIEGSYRENDMTLSTWQRHVIAAAGGQNYLVTATVTAGASEARRGAPAYNAIVNGFQVAPAGVSGPPNDPPPAPEPKESPAA